MLSNYYLMDPNMSVSSFLKENNEKKNMHYIVLDTDPKTYIDTRTLAFNIKNINEKLDSIKKTIPKIQTDNIGESVNFLIKTGEDLIENNEGLFDFIDALNFIQKSNSKILKRKLDEIFPNEIFALEENDLISNAKKIFVEKKIQIMPVIDEKHEIIGEIRPFDFLSSALHNAGSEQKGFYSEKYDESILNLPVKNIMNNKPLLVSNNKTFSDAIEIMIKKKVPSLIVEEKGKIFSIIETKKIFSEYLKLKEEENYSINIIGEDSLFEDEKKLIRGFAIKYMEKMKKTKINLQEMKIDFKVHGNKQSGHKRKGILKVSVIYNNKNIHVEKDILSERKLDDSLIKIKNDWNVPKIFQELLNAIDKRIESENRNS